MEVLLLTSQLPYPPDTGAKTRTYNLIKRLSLRHNMTLVTFAKKEESAKVEALKKLCREIELIPKNRFNYIDLCLNLFSTLPYNVKKYYSKEIVRTIKNLVKKNNFDLIHCDSLQVSLNLSSINTISKVLTEHNIESDIFERYAKNQPNPLKRLFIYLQWRKLKDYELNTCKRFDCCITVSEKDKLFIEKGAGVKNIFVVPNGVDTEYFRLQTTLLRQGFGGQADHRLQTEEEALVFTGSMDWLPNTDAVEYFYREMLPLIWKERPHVKFYIVGKNSSFAIWDLAKKDKRVVVTGEVQDVRPYIAKSKVFIAPLRIGGGTRLKILEAMAMAKPVVSTSIGAEGLEVKSEENIILADKPEIFAKRVKDLLENSELRKNIGNKARKLVEEKYEWSSIAERLEKAWEATRRRNESFHN